MAKRVQMLRGNTAWNNAFTGQEGEATYDTQAKELRMHDGVTPGGARFANVNTIPTLSRKVISQTQTIAGPGNILAASMDRFLTLSTAGEYILPDRGTIDIGQHLLIQAVTAGISVKAFAAGQAISDRGNLVQSRSLNAGELIHIFCSALTGSFAWHVLSSY